MQAVTCEDNILTLIHDLFTALISPINQAFFARFSVPRSLRPGNEALREARFDAYTS